MFVTTKVRAKITDDDPVFKTRYLGNVEVFVPNGKGCTNAPVQKLWDNSGEEKYMKKVSTIITTHGIIMKDSENKKDEGKLYPIENISFCNAESIANGRIFSWISQEENGHRLICNAVLCSTPEKAKSMALVMSRAFQIAYKEWKMDRSNIQRSERKQSVTAKTSDLKLKPKYQIPHHGTTNLQNGKADTSNGSPKNGELHSNPKTQTSENDNVSIKSSGSSGKDSVDSNFKDSKCQTASDQNSQTKVQGSNNANEQTQERHEQAQERTNTSEQAQKGSAHEETQNENNTNDSSGKLETAAIGNAQEVGTQHDVNDCKIKNSSSEIEPKKVDNLNPKTMSEKL